MKPTLTDSLWLACDKVMVQFFGKDKVISTALVNEYVNATFIFFFSSLTQIIQLDHNTQQFLIQAFNKSMTKAAMLQKQRQRFHRKELLS